MLQFNPKELSVPDVHKLVLGGIAPRPISFVSTISNDGIPNLSPFSFYNAFSANPPIVVFSPSRSGRTNKTKDTYNNLMENGECVIQAVTYDMLEQMNLASSEFAPEVNEFEVTGFTPIESKLIKPFRVKESPFQMECKLRQMYGMGDGPAAGNLAVCEILMFHVDESILNNGVIDPQLIDHVGRNGGSWYTRASGDAIFELEKPKHASPIGYSAIPEQIRNSFILSGNDIGKLASSTAIPEQAFVDEFLSEIEVREASMETFNRYASVGEYTEMLSIALHYHNIKAQNAKHMLELTAKIALSYNDTDCAWVALLVK
jgi:flavin reductase (DIM6/NTAB) family NADH-FMN oxidoreductase RutF